MTEFKRSAKVDSVISFHFFHVKTSFFVQQWKVKVFDLSGIRIKSLHRLIKINCRSRNISQKITYPEPIHHYAVPYFIFAEPSPGRIPETEGNEHEIDGKVGKINAVTPVGVMGFDLFVLPVISVASTLGKADQTSGRIVFSSVFPVVPSRRIPLTGIRLWFKFPLKSFMIIKFQFTVNPYNIKNGAFAYSDSSPVCETKCQKMSDIIWYKSGDSDIKRIS